MQPDNVVRLYVLVLGLKVDHLPPDHATTTAGGSQRTNQLAAHGGVGVSLARDENLEGSGLQGITGQHRGRFVEGDVKRGLPATNIVVVHAWQVVVN